MNHPNITELLAIRDGESTSASVHVSTCQICQDELNKIEILVAELCHLHEPQLPEDAWEKIVAKHNNTQPKPPGKPTPLSKVLYALAASVLLVGFITLLSPNKTINTPLVSVLPELKAESRALEHILANYQTNSLELSASQQFKIEKIQWELMLLDQKLSLNNKQNNEKQLEKLWLNRIENLTTLHAIYNNNPEVMLAQSTRNLI